jgi:transposase
LREHEYGFQCLARRRDHAKKKTWHAAERETPKWKAKRDAYEQEISAIPHEDRVYLDESGVNRAMASAYGRSPKGERAYGTRPARRGQNTTMAGMITGDGDFHVNTFRKPMNGPAFLGFLAGGVLPKLRPGQVIIMDNPRIHHIPGIREVIEEAGCRLLYLPTYSPELNPIEECWSKVKAKLRAIKAWTQEALESAVQAVVRTVTPQDAAGWFVHSDTFLTRNQLVSMPILFGDS